MNVFSDNHIHFPVPGDSFDPHIESMRNEAILRKIHDMHRDLEQIVDAINDLETRVSALE